LGAGDQDDDAIAAKGLQGRAVRSGPGMAFGGVRLLHEDSAIGGTFCIFHSRDFRGPDGEGEHVGGVAEMRDMTKVTEQEDVE